MSSDVPGLRGLARRVASGELQGPAAFDAVVALITAAEAQPGWGERQISQLRDEVVLGVRHDRELCALLFERQAEDGVMADAAELLREAARKRRAPAAAPSEDAADAARRASAPPKAPKRRPDADDDLGEFAGPQRRTRLVGVGVVAAVVVGGAAFWWFTRSGPCDLLVQEICFDASTKDCKHGAFGDALAKGGIDDAKCEQARTDIAAALEGVDNSQRSKEFTRALVDSLGFDPRGDDAPALAPTEEELAAKAKAPVPVIKDQPGITSLFVDSSHLYWTRPDPPSVLKARSIGGMPELIGATPDPIDVTATRDYVYWVSRAGPQTQVWVDPKRGAHEPAPLLTTGFLPQRAAFLGADFVFVDAVTGAVVIAAVAGGVPRALTQGGVPAPTLLAGDATTAYWITPAPVGTLASAKIDGSVPAAVAASGLQDPRALIVDGSGVYWIEGSTGSIMRLKPGTATIETLATKQADPMDLALDEERVYWTNAGGGTVMAMSKTGGEAVALADDQSTPTHLVVDGAAVYWVAGADVMRVPK